jgi:hypothetical protein
MLQTEYHNSDGKEIQTIVHSFSCTKIGIFRNSEIGYDTTVVTEEDYENYGVFLFAP